MEKEIMDIVYNRSIENKYLTDEDLLNIVLVLKKMYNPLDEVGHFEINNTDKYHALAKYSHIDKDIVIFRNSFDISDKKYKGIFGDFLKDNYVFFFNLYYVLNIIHEFRHAMEKNIKPDSLITELVSREYRVLHDPLRYINKEYNAEEIKALIRGDFHIYKSLYDCAPSERLANLASLKQVVSMLRADDRFDDRIEAVYGYMLAVNHMKGYHKDFTPPTVRFLIWSMKLDEFEDLSIFDKNSGKLLYDTNSHPLYERLDAGLFISNEEYETERNRTIVMGDAIIRKKK